MGLMTSSGCFSRVLGPVFVSFIYTSYGTVWVFSITGFMMILSMIWLLYFKERLKPQEPNQVDEKVEKLLK